MNKIKDVVVAPPRIPMKLEMPVLQCQIRGCRSLEWKCKDCGRVACTAEARPNDECMCFHTIDGFETFVANENTMGVRPIWFDAKKTPAPPMETVLLCVDGKVLPGWNESVQPEEGPSYCSWEHWPESLIGGEGVTHWMPLPLPPIEFDCKTVDKG